MKFALLEHVFRIYLSSTKEPEPIEIVAFFTFYSFTQPIKMLMHS
jgi:hypothetical protein